MALKEINQTDARNCDEKKCNVLGQWRNVCKNTVRMNQIRQIHGYISAHFFPTGVSNVGSAHIIYIIKISTKNCTCTNRINKEQYKYWFKKRTQLVLIQLEEMTIYLW